MRKEHRYYEVTPRVVPANRHSTITIRPRHDHCRFTPGTTYSLDHVMMESSTHRYGQPAGHRCQAQPDADGALRLTAFFAGEQEHVLTGLQAPASPPGDPRFTVHLHLYSVEPDLLARRPFKGDFHLHSTGSDGMESPPYVAAACRRRGLDFMALTDHGNHQASLEAAVAFADLPHDLGIFPGEEVHPPHNMVHIVSFGAGSAITPLFTDPDYEREIEARCSGLGLLPDEADPYLLASCMWTFEKIRAAGGLAIFVHPFWTYDSHYNVPSALTDQILLRGGFDAFEVLGWTTHHKPEGVLLQAARYHQEAAAGRCYPVVGCTDAHGCESGQLWGWCHTVVFSPASDLASLQQSIRDGWSLAVQTFPGEYPRPVGPFRLVKFGLFLQREVFPEHDEYCAEEGQAMLRCLDQAHHHAPALAALQGRCRALYQRIWAAPA